MPHLAVLGGSGWLGSALLESLRGDAVDLEVTAPGRADLEGRDASGLLDLLQPTEDLTVVNCVGVIRGSDEEIRLANEEFALRLVEALFPTGAYLVHLGSAAEYGDPGSSAPIPESAPCRPVTLYGRTKQTATRAVLSRPDWCVLRPFNLIDGRMPSGSPLLEIRQRVRLARATEDAVALLNGRTLRDHVTRGFVARSLAHAASHRVGGVYNLCSGVGLTYRDITEQMCLLSGGRLPIRDLQRETGIPAVVGDPTSWAEESGLAEAMDARQVAALVMSG